ncbi:hypothetical protein BKA82DRAFT_4136271 [Pisolithus tinctorius]|nr:hypothetical protein BKA82DRAFT_4136271 [Pisolithus tinctorius]
MSPKRTRKPTPKSDGEDSSDSYSDFRHDLKRPRSNSPWNITDNTSADNPPLKIYVLSVKFDATTYQSLVCLVEDCLLRVGKDEHSPATLRRVELSANLEEADVIVTAIRTRPRLERHVNPSLAKSRPIVTAEWLQNSVRSGFLLPCADYAALRDFRKETARLCPDQKQGDVIAPEQLGAPPKPQVFRDPEELVDARDAAALDHTSRYSCQRGSPLSCPNQGLVRELDVIRRCRFVEGEERSVLSYSRAIATIKAYPSPITAEKLHSGVAKLPFLGEKILSMIEEYTGAGKIAEAQEAILSSPRFQSLSAFTAIYGIGPHTARKLYALGLRTLEELDRYYEVTPGDASTEAPSHVASDKHYTEEVEAEISIKVGLALRHDFGQLISREEAEEINRVVMEVLASIQEDCKSLIVGGYRRGKPQSNDVDIVITHSDWNSGSKKVKGLSKKLVQVLHERNIVTHVMHLSGFHEHNTLRTHNWDSLEKALTVLCLPSNAGGRRIHRRVDLIFATPEVFWTAVVGWTGSTMFQRDLRLWAKQQKGMKFDSSGISRRRDSKLYFPKSEREVFEILGLAYVHPSLRNADA